jgi:hypothetical protein
MDTGIDFIGLSYFLWIDKNIFESLNSVDNKQDIIKSRILLKHWKVTYSDNEIFYNRNKQSITNAGKKRQKYQFKDN